MSSGSHPQVSVVLLGHYTSENFRMALDHLRVQTVSDRMEVIIIVPKRENLRLIADELRGFSHFKILELETAEGEGLAKAAGVRAATSSLVAFIEDHSYPEAGWAEALVEAHRTGDFAAVGSVMLNANPHRAASWGCFLAYYSAWMTAHPQGKVEHLPGNQSCYKRDLLLEYRSRLPDMLQTESLLHWDLRAKGHKLHLEPTARVYHLNHSQLGPALQESYFASRVFAANRSQGWGLFRKFFYALGSPLLPLIRLRRILHDASRADLKRPLILRALLPLTLNLCASAAGEMFGYAFGAGKAREGLLRCNSKRHLHHSVQDLEDVAKL